MTVSNQNEKADLKFASELMNDIYRNMPNDDVKSLANSARANYKIAKVLADFAPEHEMPESSIRNELLKSIQLVKTEMFEILKKPRPNDITPLKDAEEKAYAGGAIMNAQIATIAVQNLSVAAVNMIVDDVDVLNAREDMKAAFSAHAATAAPPASARAFSRHVVAAALPMLLSERKLVL